MSLNNSKSDELHSLKLKKQLVYVTRIGEILPINLNFINLIDSEVFQSINIPNKLQNETLGKSASSSFIIFINDSVE